MKKAKLVAILSVLTISFNSFVFANDKVKLTVNEAVNRATSYSRSLKNYEEQKILSEENHDSIKDKYILATDEASSLNLAVSLKESLNNINNIDNNSAIEKENIEYNIIKFFTNVLNAEDDLKISIQKLKNAETDLEIAKIKKQLGTISELEYNTQKLAYDQMVTSIQTKQNSLTTAYNSLSKVLGENINTQYELILDEKYKTFEKLENKNLDYYIATALSTSQKIKELEKQIDIAQYKSDVYSLTFVNSSTKKSLDIDYAKNTRNLTDVKVILKDSVTELFNSILTMESSYDNQVKQISKLENDLNVLNVKNQIGRATDLEIKNLQANIETAKLELQKLIFNHNLSKMKLNNINLS